MQKVTIEPFNMIGIAIRTTNEGGKGEIESGDLWQRFIGENILGKIPNKIDDTIYSMYTEYESDHTKPYTTIIGCKVKSLDTIPEGMVGKSFDGGTYMKSSAKGDLMKGLVGKHWGTIWGSDIDRAYTGDFEVYGEKAQNPADAKVDFYIAIKE